MIHPSLANARGDVRMRKGGGENAVAWLAEALGRRGHRVHLLTSAYDDEMYGPRSGAAFTVEEIGGPGWGEASLWQQWRFGRRLARAVAGFDLVNPHGYPSYVWVTLARRGVRRFPPAVWYCHEPDRSLYDDQVNQHFPIDARMRLRPPGFLTYVREIGLLRTLVDAPSAVIPPAAWAGVMRALDRRFVRAMDGIMTNSQFTAGHVRAIYGAQTPVEPCHPGVPLAPEPPRRDGLGSVILSVGRLLPSKNLHLVLDAVRLLADRGQPARLRIVGDGPEMGPLRARTEALGIADRVTFAGLVADDAMSSEWERARVVAYPPLDEPFGLVPLEAGARGIPVVVSDHGGPAETIRHGQTGLLVPPDRPDRLADALGSLLADEAHALRLGRALQEDVYARFGTDQFAARFEACLARLGVAAGSRTGGRARASG